MWMQLNFSLENFIFMIFGLPGAALAMYQCANPEAKKKTASLLLSAALTSALTGITEPIEFSFLFVAPLLYVVDVLLARHMFCGCTSFTGCDWIYFFSRFT